ncbi:MAG: phenylalanine--tRNA ligase subunit alpha [Acholeplasmataceae bacterium]
MNDKLQLLKGEATHAIEASDTLELLEALRVKYLSKKGEITQIMSEIRNVAPEDRPLFGQQVNELKTYVEQALYDKKQVLEDRKLLTVLETEKIDVTLPGYQLYSGSIHPLNQVIEDLEDFFIGMGYQIADGPEVETDYYNFEMMNLEKDHPARDMQDTFYINDELLLRTHTSPVQARTMLKMHGQPLKIVCPGKVYRRDDDDPTHSHQFMQMEGLVVGKNVSLANLKDALLNMAKHLFGPDRDIRLRPSFFPFTEPSYEVDVSYIKKDGTKGYIEVLGSGMVHPNVLKMGGYDPEVYSGFAFGVGIERIAILKYNIDDIRHFYLNDLRFLNQFKGEIQ